MEAAYFLKALVVFILQTTIHGAGSKTTGSTFHMLDDLSGLAGQEVSISCTVDVASCGDFHSVKWYRESQRVFVFSELANLERSEGSLTNRARFMFSPNESQAALKISNLQLSDEGVYRCEITYLEINEGCPVVQYVNLTVLAAPENVEILLEDGRTATRNVSRIGPFNEGTTVTLLCRSGGGRPVPHIEWWNGTQVLDGETVATKEEGGGVTGINRLQVVLTRYDLAAQWQCRAHSPALSLPLTSDLHIDVHVKPAMVTITGLDAPVTEGTAVVVYCIAEGARPAATITWFNASSPLQKNTVETTQLQVDGTFTTKSRLIFTLNRYDHRRYLICQATNSVEDHPKAAQATQLLRVEYAPVVAVSPENITVNESMDVLIFCTYEANPISLLSVHWFKDDKEIDIDDRDKYEGATIDQPALLLKKATREDAGAYSCRLKNAIGTGESDNVAFLSVQYPAEVKLVMEPALVNELERPNVTLNCQIITGYPPVLLGVRWFLDGELLKELPDCPLNESSPAYPNYDDDLCNVDPSKLLLEYVGRSFQGNYSCVGMNAAGWGSPSDLETLIIYYPPGNTSLTYEPEVVVKDDEMVLNCGVSDVGQPSVSQYRWTRNGHLIPEISDFQWNVSQVTLNYQANYSCTPVNEAGEGETATIEIEVFAPPKFIERLPSATGALSLATDGVNLSCRVECFPLCQIEWFHNGKPVRNSAMFTISESYLPENVKFNQHQSVKSTLSFNTDMYEQTKFEPANFTCTSTENAVGQSVSSTTVFRVEFAPESVIIDRSFIEVEEGSTGGYLECLASAYPQANYYWQYNHQIIGNGPRLTLDYGLSRDKTGEYSCVAHNQHGNSSAKAFINVVYKPECSINLREVEGKTRLICEVKANPKLVDFVWMFNNTTLSKDIVHLGLQSMLILDGPPPSNGIFYCYVNNSVGLSTPCEINIAGGLLAKLGDENIIIIAVIAAAIVVILVVCIVLLVLCQRKRAEDKYNSGGTMVERENPEGDSMMSQRNLQHPTIQQIHQHKWPLRPGVQVHINGSKSIANAATEAVSTVNRSNQLGYGIGPRTIGLSHNQSTEQFLEEEAGVPYYETLRDKKQKVVNENQSMDSGSESTRSVIRVPIPSRMKNMKLLPLNATSVGNDMFDRPVLPSVVESSTTSRKRKKPSGDLDLTAAAADSKGKNDSVQENKAFYENLPFHGLQNAPNKELASRPSSQMSHAASSGYGSARSNRVMGNSVSGGTLATPMSHHKRSRNSFLSSLRRAKLMDSAALFRSLRLPRTDPDSSAVSPNENESEIANPACRPSEIATLPCRSSLMKDGQRPKNDEETLHPVPAPRFHTLKRHAYQNIPIPLNKNSVSKSSHPVQTNTLPALEASLPWKNQTTALMNNSHSYTRVYEPPFKKQQQPLPSQHASIVYADMSVSHIAQLSSNQNEIFLQTPLTDPTYLQFMSAGKEVQV